MPTHNAAGHANRERAKTNNSNPQQKPNQDGEPPLKKRCTARSGERTNKKIETSSTRPPVKIFLTKPGSTRRPPPNGARTSLALRQDGQTTAGTRPSTDEHLCSARERQDAGKDQNDKRVLRSQDGGGRGTSELANFFPEYYDVLYGEAPDPDSLNVDSVLCITDEKPRTGGQKLAIRARETLNARPRDQTSNADSRHAASGPKSAAASFQTLDLSPYEQEALDFTRDPLADDEYLASHKRGERAEKHDRNKDREQNVHEKAQLEGLLGDLKSAEWPKTMGIPGNTDADRRHFEPMRNHYIGKVREVLAKFEDWKEKEKQMRLRKEEAAARAAREDDADSDEDDEEIPVIQDASALQLQQEAGLQSNGKIKIKLRMPVTHQEEVIQKPFTSFFAKPHERLGALGKHRRGRHVMAFGHPIPDVPDEDFELPGSLSEGEEHQHRKHARRK